MRPKAVCAVVIAHVSANSAGNAWAFLNWALGFRQAGWDVWLVEHLDADALAWPAGVRAPGESLNERLWRELVDELGFSARATLFIDGDAPSAPAFTEFARHADLFVNLSGQFKLHDRVRAIPRRVYLDMDPTFTQLWAVECGVDMNFAGHTDFFTYGAALETADLPATGHAWQPTLPPVSLDVWSPEAVSRDATPLPPAADPDGAWTTVTHWYGCNQVAWNGRLYGNKRDSLAKLRELPRHGVSVVFATDLEPGWEDHAGFVAAGWRFVTPAAVCADWRVYRKFLAASAGELSVAKDGYVVSGCGWIGDRSATYLALGRPVALQDTGWSCVLPAGAGIKRWRSLEEAAEALRELSKDPALHAAAARRLAERHFDAALVVRRMLARL